MTIHQLIFQRRLPAQVERLLLQLRRLSLKLAVSDLRKLQALQKQAPLLRLVLKFTRSPSYVGFADLEPVLGGGGGGGNGGNNPPNTGGGGNSGGNQALVLDPKNVQDASSKTGQEAGDNPAQADSLTDSANFINFCTGKTLTNGQQVKSGSCNGIVMGDIPSTANMISTIITSPSPGETISANTEFTVKVSVANLVAGSFTSEFCLD